jgi:formylglycine-generating enzyme required for sulfatase activity
MMRIERNNNSALTAIIVACLSFAGCLLTLDTSGVVLGDSDAAQAADGDVLIDGDAADVVAPDGEGDTLVDGDIAEFFDTLDVDAQDPDAPDSADADLDTRSDADIDVTPAITCVDLDCVAEGRDCDEGTAGEDAACGECLSGFIEDGDECVAPSCRAAGDCTPDPVASEWGVCGGYADTCAREGTQTRLVYTGDCVSGQCEVTSVEQSQPCPEMRVTDGDACVIGSTVGECRSGTCVEPGLDLGDACTADSQCPSSSWCSTVSGFRRCSPRLFSGQSHQMDFVYVPSGTFSQGTPGATNVDLPYTATLTRSYFVSRTEVTQGQWKAATGGTNPAYFQNSTCTNGTCSSTENANNSGPVEQVDLYSTLAYANWLSSQNGLQQCYSLIPSSCADSVSDWAAGDTSCTGATFTGLGCTGYRLLTESEWERAARGGTTSPYYWGESTDTSTVGQHAWFSSNSGSRTQGVGQKLMNGYGLYDMSGNVWEWVWDWVYLPDGSNWHFYPSGSATDYVGPSTGSFRGFRGGSWDFSASFLPSAFRNGGGPTDRVDDLGVRLARTLP